MQPPYPNRLRRLPTGLFCSGSVYLQIISPGLLIVGTTCSYYAEDHRTIFPGSAKACRIFSQKIYRQLGIETSDTAGKRTPPSCSGGCSCSATCWNNLELPWLPTEQGKVGFFESLGIPRKLLPSRLYQGSVDKQTRYFPLKLPIAADTQSAAAGRRFVYVDPGHATDTELRSWGRAHRHLWGLLQKKGLGVHVVAIGPKPEGPQLL